VTDKAAVRPVVAVTDEMSPEIVGEEEVASTGVARVRELHRAVGVVGRRVLDHVFAQLHCLQKLRATRRADVRHDRAARVLALPVTQLLQPALLLCTACCRISTAAGPVHNHTARLRTVVLFRLAVTLQ